MELQPGSTHWSDSTWCAIFGIRLQLRHPTHWSSCPGLTARRQGTRRLKLDRSRKVLSLKPFPSDRQEKVHRRKTCGQMWDSGCV